MVEWAVKRLKLMKADWSAQRAERPGVRGHLQRMRRIRPMTSGDRAVCMAEFRGFRRQRCSLDIPTEGLPLTKMKRRRSQGSFTHTITSTAILEKGTSIPCLGRSPCPSPSPSPSLSRSRQLQQACFLNALALLDLQQLHQSPAK